MVMKKYYDSFLTNTLFAVLIIMAMVFSENLFAGFTLIDLAYGAFCSLGGSFLGETIKTMTLGRWYNWIDLLIGALVGLILVFTGLML